MIIAVLSGNQEKATLEPMSWIQISIYQNM